MNYSEKEKKAIEILNQFREGRLERDKLEIRAHGGFKIGEIYKMLELNPAIYTVLNLVETQKVEIEKKEKAMNLMAEQLTTPINDKKWVIEYYTKLAEEEK